MDKNIIKLICFADETGQDTKGKFFLVATCVINANKELILEDLLSKIEIKTNKKFNKWTKCTNSRRKNFLDTFTKSNFPTNSLAYSLYYNTLEYANLISSTIAKSVLNKVHDNQKYTVKIFFDRINKKIERKIKLELRKLKINVKKVRGIKDESLALIRLTDSMAGFIRDFKEGKPYTIRYKRYVERIQQI